MNLLILGPPGSGKGTMAKMLAEYFGILHISTGNLFRDNIRNKTDLGLKAQEYVTSGGLVPDELTMDMLKNRLEQVDAQKGVLLDGFPRTLAQAEMLDKEVQVDRAIFMNVSDQIVVERMTLRRVCNNCGMIFHLKHIPPKKVGVCDVCKGELVQREDQKEEVVRHRLQVYKEQTLPVVRHYKKNHLLVEIDAEPAPDVIFKSITDQISLR